MLLLNHNNNNSYLEKIKFYFMVEIEILITGLESGVYSSSFIWEFDSEIMARLKITIVLLRNLWVEKNKGRVSKEACPTFMAFHILHSPYHPLRMY